MVRRIREIPTTLANGITASQRFIPGGRRGISKARLRIIVATFMQSNRDTAGLGQALRGHWPEYLMEAALLGLFMLSACGFSALLAHPGSPAFLGASVLRRWLMGVAMGSTAVALICSPWGQRSGAHMNPATTLTFLLLGKVRPVDAGFYIAAQFVGGVAGVLAAGFLLGRVVSDPQVNYAATVPGPWGEPAAFAAEVAIAFGLMLTVLTVSNSPRLTRRTPWFAGLLVALYITFESPVSGMSMNPARTFGSAFAAGETTGLWIYFTAPLAGMFAAALVYSQWRGAHRVFCAKFHHHNHQRCIFRCRYGELA